MGKSKKPFIDKKNSSTYHLLYRSQRDVAEAEEGESAAKGPGVVLWPSPNNNKETDQKVLIGKSNDGSLEDGTLNDWKSKLSRAGLVDEYDYEKHMKPITGTGKFLDVAAEKSARKQTNAMVDARSRNIEDETVNEVDRQLEAIALTADCMDKDIADALFGDFDEDNYEELDDEFMLDAAKPPEEGEEEEAFDFAAHVKTLMEKARLEAEGGPDLGTIHEQGQQDHDFFSKAKPLGEDDEDDYFDENDWQIEGTPGVVAKLSEAAEKALCDKFNETLAEYDSDNIGEGFDDDDVLGDRPLEGDVQVEAALDDYLQEKKDDIFMQGQRHYMEGNYKGGSGFSALVGTKMIPVKDLEESAPVQGAIRPLADLLGEADQTLGINKAAPPAEEIFIDGKSYFSEKMRNPWDCESILSTYSNLDNNPVTIGGGGRRRRKKGKNKSSSASIAEDEESVQRILLSEKTGLPLGVLPSREYEGGQDTYVSVNKGEARKKVESKDEKKLRKVCVKKERQMARMQKKMMKEAFNDEFSKRAQEVLSDDVGGKTVFRF